MEATGYAYRKVTKFDKNLLNVPEILGRIIVGLVKILDNQGTSNPGLCSLDLDNLINFVYKNPQPTRRRDYIRKFVQRNYYFFKHFIRDNGIKTVKTSRCKYASFFAIGRDIRHKIIASGRGETLVDNVTAATVEKRPDEAKKIRKLSQVAERPKSHGQHRPTAEKERILRKRRTELELLKV